MMMQGIRGFVLGFWLGGAVFFIPALASVKQVEENLDKFIGSFKCRIVEVQDIDLWEGKVLVKAQQLGLSFVMTAQASATYEICPVGVGVTSFKELPKGKK